jgi:hypothetical protein
MSDTECIVGHSIHYYRQKFIVVKLRTRNYRLLYFDKRLSFRETFEIKVYIFSKHIFLSYATLQLISVTFSRRTCKMEIMITGKRTGKGLGRKGWCL